MTGRLFIVKQELQIATADWTHNRLGFAPSPRTDSKYAFPERRQAPRLSGDAIAQMTPAVRALQDDWPVGLLQFSRVRARS